MREVIVSVRCDGAVARRSIAPSPDAVYGRGMFDEPQPLHCPSKVFAVVKTSDHSKETAMVRVVRRDCRVDVLENGEHSVRDCLWTVFEESFWHNRYARRDLERLTAAG
jgi:hypothetical protein